jgi:penicillin-binding protein 2
LSRKIFRFAVIMLLLLVVLGGRLGWVSLIESDNLSEKALSQSTRTLDYYQYARGDFLDTYGRKITNNEATCCIIFPVMLTDTHEAAISLSQICDLPEKKLRSRLAQAQKERRAPFCLIANLSSAEAVAIEEVDLPGVFTVVMAPRYPKSGGAAHLLGFVAEGEIPHVYAGKSGLEKQYDSYLTGRLSPQVAIMVDDQGREILGRGFRLLNPKGHDTSANVKLTLNADYQLKVEEAMLDTSGAAVILDVNSGDILALCSTPFMDPYMLEEPINDDVFINKAFASYPPASTFKIVVTAAALAEGLETPTNFNCQGSYLLPHGQIMNCWLEKGHGLQNIDQALANSCNPYFAALGLQVGGDNLKKYGELLGLSEQKILGYETADTIHIDFNSAVAGDVVNASIGEKGIRVSPLMIARLLAVCGNKGKLVTPRLVKQVIHSDGKVLETVSTLPPQQVIEAQHAEKIKKMLRLAVVEGTAQNAAATLVETAAKTGTSQHQGVWFAGLVPADEPRWSIVIYLENATAGGQEGAAVFTEIVNELAILDNL